MKKIFAYTLFTLLFNACAHNVDTEKEKEAIKAVIESETHSYLMKDVDQRSKSFLHDERVIILVSGKRNYGYTVGYNQIFENHKKSFKKNPIPSTNSFKNINYKITVYDKSAWAVYDEMNYSSTGEFIEKIINSRFLEKVNGEWKIVYLSHVDITSYEEE